MWSADLHDMHTGLAAAAVPGLNALCGSPGYRSVSTSQILKSPPAVARPFLPSLLTKRPPKARSTTTWSYSAKACERGSLCSRVKPCGIINLSNAGFGDGPVARLFSLVAVLSKFMLYSVRYWFWWQLPQDAGSTLVAGLPLPLSRCVSSPSWQLLQATDLCVPSA